MKLLNPSGRQRIFPGFFVILILHHFVDAKETSEVVLKRAKRQFELEQGNQVIDSIFQIPIQTLTAVSNLWKTTRPITYRIRQQVLNGYQQYASRPGYTGGYYPSDYSYSTFQQRPAFSVQRPTFYNQRQKKEKPQNLNSKQKKKTLDIDE
nr:PREDICTED: uncharacterized protein LOC109035973 [Bemisia tabaci]